MFSSWRLSAFRLPGRTNFSRFPNVLRSDDHEGGGQKWYRLVLVSIGMGVLLVGALIALEYFVCGAQ
jgi:hypothetical protein